MSENPNQPLDFAFRRQNKSKYLRSRLNRECNSKVNYFFKKVYQLHKEELKFLFKATFVP